MLEAVGHAVAVNPEAKLAAVARKRGWHVEQWAPAPGGTKPLLPLAALRSGGRFAAESAGNRPPERVGRGR